MNRANQRRIKTHPSSACRCRSAVGADRPAHVRHKGRHRASCRTSGRLSLARRRMKSYNGKSRRTRVCSNRCSSSLIPICRTSTYRRWRPSVDEFAGAGRSRTRASTDKSPSRSPDRTLSEEERLRAWIYIDRQRKEWTPKRRRWSLIVSSTLGRASAGKYSQAPFANWTSAVFELSSVSTS